MCASRTAWNGTTSYNPAGVLVRVREYRDDVHSDADVRPWRNLQGGPYAADHVDILGNEDLLDDVLRIVAGRGVPHEQVFSDLGRVVSETALLDVQSQ